MDPGYVYIQRKNKGPLMGNIWIITKGPNLKKS